MHKLRAGVAALMSIVSAAWAGQVPGSRPPPVPQAPPAAAGAPLTLAQATAMALQEPPADCRRAESSRGRRPAYHRSTSALLSGHRRRDHGLAGIVPEPPGRRLPFVFAAFQPFRPGPADHPARYRFRTDEEPGGAIPISGPSSQPDNAGDHLRRRPRSESRLLRGAPGAGLRQRCE